MSVEEARRYYNEFRGRIPLNQHELVNPSQDDVWAQEYRPVPVTFGFEVEQDAEDISYAIRGEETISGEQYHWHRDGSGPLETTFGGGKYPGVPCRDFVEYVKKKEVTWIWRSEIRRRRRGCGSHLHFRPREEDLSHLRMNVVNAWTTTYNTLLEVTPLVAPLFCWGGMTGHFGYRNKWKDWAKLNTTRLATRSVRSVLDYPEDSSLRHYRHVTWNERKGEDFPPHMRKPLTIEMRLAETHPGIAYEAAILVNRVIRKCIDRGFVSPKLDRTEDRTLNMRLETFNRIDNALEQSRIRSSETHNLYELMDTHVAVIDFEPGRGIPDMEEHYPTWSTFFDDFLRTYGDPYHPMARVCRLFLHRGVPSENQNAVWDIFNEYGDFSWDQDIPSR